MSITEAFVKTLTNPSIVSAITSTIFIILLGFYLRKTFFQNNLERI